MDIVEISLSRTNLSQQVADHLEQFILSSAIIKVDEKLPSEMKLAQQYNVSRPVIREALKLLQERGLITLKNGSGAYVTRPESDTVINAISRIMQIDHISAEDLTQVREILEMSSVTLAVQHVTDEQLKEMDELLTRFEDTSIPFAERVKIDETFHILVAQATGNELLSMFVRVLTSLLFGYMGKGILTPGGVEDGIQRHRRIYDALKLHDLGEARQAMADHLKVSSENVRYFDQKNKIAK